MSHNLEDELTRVLAAAAHAAPGPEPGFEAAIADRRRHRRQARIASAAGLAAVVVVMLAIPVGAALTARDEQQAAQSPMSTIDLDSAGPAEEVWPGAVIRLPEQLPDGRSLTVARRLDDDRFLVAPTGGPDGYSFPVVYNARTHQVTELMTATAPPGVHGFGFGGIGIGSDTQIVWVATGRIGGTDAKHGYSEIWTAPASGGPSTRRAVFDLPGEIALVSAFGGADTLYVSVTALDPAGSGSRIYQLPTDGGEPQVVPGTEGYRWTPTSPGAWVSQATTAPVGADLGPTRVAGPPVTYWNLDTGERRTPQVLPGLTGVHCTPQICVGSNDNGLVTYRFDGTRITELTGGPPSSAGDVFSIIEGSGRFIRPRWSQAAFVVDLTTHTAAALPAEFAGAYLLPDQTVTLRRADGEQTLLDLTRIP